MIGQTLGNTGSQIASVSIYHSKSGQPSTSGLLRGFDEPPYRFWSIGGFLAARTTGPERVDRPAEFMYSRLCIHICTTQGVTASHLAR